MDQSPLPDDAWKGSPSKYVVLGRKVIVRELCRSLRVKPFELIGELMRMGRFVSLLQTIDFDTARAVCLAHGFEVCPRAAVDAKIREGHPKLPPVLPAKVVLPMRVPVALLGRKLGLAEADVLAFLAHLGLEASMDEILEFPLVQAICRYLGVEVEFGPEAG